MDELSWNVGKLSDPHSYISALRIKFCGLKCRVKCSDLAWPDPSSSSPPSVVWLHIMIDQLLFKVVSTIPPVLLHIQSEIAGYNLSATIWHKASCVHLPHQSINQWHTSLAISPSLNNFWVCRPLQKSSIVDSVNTEHLVAIVHAPKTVEVPPEKLINKMFCALVGPKLGLKFFRLVVDSLDRKGTVCEPWW
jgi:hypothetical protein